MATIYRPTYTQVKDGKKIRRKSMRWYIRYLDADGIRRQKAGFKDKAATTQLMPWPTYGANSFRICRGGLNRAIICRALSFTG